MEEIKILIADDDANARKTLTDVLEMKKGWEVEGAEDGARALALLESSFFNSVLLDIKLPGMNGLDVLEKIKEINEDIVVIMITAFASLPTSIEAMNKGAFSYITKPLDIEQTIAIIEKGLNLQSLSLEKKRLTKELEESEKKYKVLFENANDAIFITDPQTEAILDANKQARKLIGRSKEEIIGMFQFQLYPQEKVGFYKTRFKERIRAKDLTPFEGEVIRQDGTMIPVTISTSITELGGKKIIQSIFRDISELKKLETELIQSSKMVAMGQLTAGISHELSQPLTGIKGYAQSILMSLDSNSPFRADLQKIEEQADRMDKIIQNVGLFTRKSSFKLEKFNINKPISDALLLLTEQLKLHNIRVKQSLGKNLPLTRGDANQLQQVFINLITNARDAIDSLNNPKGGELIIKSALDKQNKHIVLTFKDSGCGISRVNLEHIFNPFFTTKSPGGGLGLGLSVVYRIIENHKGGIEVESLEGKGTTFKIILPVA